MSTEPVETTAAPAEAEKPAPDATLSPEVVEPGTVEEDATSEPTAEDKAARAFKRMERRIDRISAAKYQAIARAEAAEARLASLETKPDGDDTKIDPVELAREISQVDRVTERANGIAKDGEKRFTDFKDTLNGVIEEAGPLFDKKGHATSLGDAIMDSDDPAKLINYLGKNPDIASELEGLNAAQLGRRLAKIEGQMTTKPQSKVSKASEPIKPLNAKSDGSKSLESAKSFAEYKEIRAKQGARWAR